MSSKRFVAKTAREVMTQVRNELGADATIISHREINGWHEITATQAPKSVPQNAPKEAPGSDKQLLAKRAQEMLALFNSKQDAREAKLESTQKVKDVSDNKVVDQNSLEALLCEVREMKTSLQSQLNDISWGATSPHNQTKNILISNFINLGFNQDLIKRVIKKLPIDLGYEDALLWTRDLLNKNIKCTEDESEILEGKGAYALLGPTGVGKTTTIAKIAARYALKNGNSSVGLISTDTYRIGGNEQLRIYAKIMGVEMLVAKNLEELNAATVKLSDKKLILIDMAGLSHKDPMVETQLEMLTSTKTSIKKVLCLNANNATEGLNAVAMAYAKKGLEACIITKADEAMTLGSALNVVMKNKLKVLYLTNGQRVPEDICLLNKNNELEMMLLSQDRQEDLESDSGDESSLSPQTSVKASPQKSTKKTAQLNA
jgi:flagellar biosynthesis protein FlhF